MAVVWCASASKTYPPHVDAANLLTYAWKPAIVREVMLAYGLPLLWLDAGNLVHERLERVRAELARIGFHSPLSDGTIEKWCHPSTITALQIEPDILSMRNRNGAMVGFGDSPLARELAGMWYELSMRPEVICPPGSSRANHRQDQTVLSVLLARTIRDHRLEPADTLLGISKHNDGLSRREARYYMQRAAVSEKERALVLRGFVTERLWRTARLVMRPLRRAGLSALQSVRARLDELRAFRRKARRLLAGRKHVKS